MSKLTYNNDDNDDDDKSKVTYTLLIYHFPLYACTDLDPFPSYMVDSLYSESTVCLFIAL